jgi:DnaJ family protein C protein 28
LYEILGVAEDCKNETLRLAFVHLAKRFHPDSGTQEADTVRFSQVLYHKNYYIIYYITLIF